MRRTKIICTMGPACSNEETLEKMVRSGMNVARLNFSHGDYEEHGGRIQLIRTVRERVCGRPGHSGGWQALCPDH